MINDKNDLAGIDDTIVSYEMLIAYQKNEISKTVTLIDDFKNCLSKQNEALKSFVEEREILEAERLKYPEIDIKIISPPLNMNDSHSAVTAKDCKEDRPKDVRAKITENSVKDLKRKIPNGDSECSKNKIQCVKYSDVTIHVTRMSIPEIKDHHVHKVLVYDNDIYVAGSNGLLLRHTPLYTHTYETCTTEDIHQIEVIKNHNTLAINVFTRDTLIIFEDVTWYKKRKAIDIPGIGDVFLDNDLLYIPFEDGLVKKYGDSGLKRAPYLSSSVCSFVPCGGGSVLALIRFHDRLVYTTHRDEPKTYRIINGLSDIRGVRKLMPYYFLCYSTNKIWALNSTFKVLTQISLTTRIMFLDVNDNTVVVVDASNTVYLYSFSVRRDRSMHASLVYQHHVKGRVMSVSLMDGSVYLSIGHDIVVLKYSN